MPPINRAHQLGFPSPHSSFMRRSTRSVHRRTLPRATPAEDAFWGNYDVVGNMIVYLTLIELVQFSQGIAKYDQASHFTHAVRERYIKGRVSRYTSPFFTCPATGSTLGPSQLTRFFHILRTTQSWIVGSVALAVSAVLGDPELRTNLNIITSYESRKDWIEFMVQDCDFAIMTDRRCSGAYGNAGARYLQFEHPDRPGLFVTVTTSVAAAIFELFFSAPATHQQVALGSHHLITPYPCLTSNQEGVNGYRPDMGNHPWVYTPIDPATYAPHILFPHIVNIHTNTDDLGRPCGEVCPAITRTAYGLKNIAHWSWGGMDGEDHGEDPNITELRRSRIEFRTGVACGNHLCIHSPAYIAPPTPVASPSSGSDFSDDD
ncbi:hypothetical protein C8R44DRAFT_947153 [Mycena epipterygia]|nr:hypothetical protein C8R44DRAFT_947153 [Mycena epipterygia]